MVVVDKSCYKAKTQMRCVLGYRSLSLKRLYGDSNYQKEGTFFYSKKASLFATNIQKRVYRINQFLHDDYQINSHSLEVNNRELIERFMFCSNHFALCRKTINLDTGMSLKMISLHYRIVVCRKSERRSK